MADLYDVAIIGGGPGGYVGAIRAAQLGLSVVCIEKRSTLGGTCLNVGCIPSKALLNSSYKYHEIKEKFSSDSSWMSCSGISFDINKLMKDKEDIVTGLTKGIDFLFSKNKVKRIKGTATIVDKNTISIVEDGSTISAKNIVIATGSVVSSLPNIEIDEEKVLSSTGALALDKVPESMVVVGAGVIGLELGSVWSRLGTKVTVVEYLDRIIPGADAEIATALQKSLTKQGIEFVLNHKVNSILHGPRGLSINVTGNADGSAKNIGCEKVLIAVGRKPNTQGLGLENIGVALNERGQIIVDDNFKTNVDGVYAIGDVIRGPMLAHKAEDEGIACVEIIAGQKPHINYDAIPSVIYTHPEVASVGKCEEELKALGVPYKVGKFNFMANSRARANMDSEGFVKVLSHKESDEVLGVHIIGAQAGDIIAEAVLAMEYKASAEDIARTCHAHPTISEALKEAAMAVDKMSIHS